MYAAQVRETPIDGLTDWLWPVQDTGAWDGPVNDWKSHKETLSVLKERRSVIQAGACCGLYPALLSQMFDAVITFEPDKQNYYFAHENTRKHSNVILLPYALGDEERLVEMDTSNIGNVGTHRVIESDVEGGDIRMRTIDSFQGLYSSVDLIWLDLEGFEYKALLGAKETIIKHRPMIGVERPTSDIASFLENLDYDHFTRSEMDGFYLPKGYRS